MIRFGPSGNEFGPTVDAPKWLRDMGLSALELNFGRGVKTGTVTAQKIGEQAREHNISISAHAPYYVNLCSADPEYFKKSYAYIKSCFDVLKIINSSDGPHRVVVHIGSQCKLERSEAIKNCKANLKSVVEKLKKDGFTNFLLCIETMGRYKTIGNFQEILDICGVSEQVIPCIDFGHINAWEQGSLQRNPERMKEIIEEFHKTFPTRPLHIHFSAVTYTKAGEHAHTTLDDSKWNFPFEPLAKILCEKKLSPHIICESKNIMAQDAKKLFGIWKSLCL